MRADRLIALLLLLQRRQRVTAAEVAVELEVSERTARRDLEALATAGLPVYSERGRGGGWQLIGGARTDLSGLSADEARALFLVAGPQVHAAPALRTALRKLAQALPEPMRSPAEGAASRVLVDPARWGEARSPSRPHHLGRLEAAVADAVQVNLGYKDRAGNESVRVVHPLGLALKGTTWYLLAGTCEGLRTFKVSRVTSVEPNGKPVERPQGFDLAEAWRQVVRDVDQLRNSAQVEALAEPEVMGQLRCIFQNRLTVGPPLDSGRVPVRLRGRALAAVVFELAGFGRRVEVLSPIEARDQLRDLGAELVDVYCPAR